MPIDPAVLQVIQRTATAHGLPLRALLSIADAESGLNPAQTNLTAPDESYGLFQLNRKGGLGAPYTPDQLLDPAFNADVAGKALGDAWANMPGADPNSFESDWGLYKRAINPGARENGPQYQRLKMKWDASAAITTTPTPETLSSMSGTTKHVAMQQVLAQNQADPANYDNQAQFDKYWAASCSAASLAAVLTAYGVPTTVGKGLDILGSRVDPSVGLLDHTGAGLAQAMGEGGVPANNQHLDAAGLTSLLAQGRPVLLDGANWLQGGHWFVAYGVDNSGVTIADSSGQGRTHLTWPEMAQYWDGWAVVPEGDPVAGATPRHTATVTQQQPAASAPGDTGTTRTSPATQAGPGVAGHQPPGGTGQQPARTGSRTPAKARPWQPTPFGRWGAPPAALWQSVFSGSPGWGAQRPAAPAAPLWL